MATETFALAVIAPGLAYMAATNPSLPIWQKRFLYGVVAGTVVVDGYFLLKWLGEK